NLTGTENAVTAAVVAGLSPGEAHERLPAMLEFVELESFADAPLRTYSDGMKLRLAFSAVAQLEPTSLLLDEVLAVGDLRLQENRFGSQEATIEGVTVEAGERLAVSFTLRASQALPRPIVGVAIHRAEDGLVCCDLNSESDGIAVPDLDPGRPLEVSLELD